MSRVGEASVEATAGLDARPSNDGAGVREGTMVGRYRIGRPLGEGGMGVVHLAHDLDLERPAAIKFLRVEHARRQRAAVRLRREAQAMARLSHPHIAEVYDVGVHEGVVYVAMEYVDGPPLSKWLASEDPRQWKEILDVFMQAGQGLSAAHAEGIVHRDFKPDNVIVGADGRVRVVDFGLARATEDTQDLDSLDPSFVDPSFVDPSFLDEERRSSSLLALSLTRVGGIVGTPAYMAPEQHTGKSSGPSADIFAFCVSLYEGLAGELPFPNTRAATVEQLTADPDKLPPLRPSVSEQIRRVLLRGMSADPDARWSNMPQVLDALAEAATPGSSMWLKAALGLGVVSLAVGASLGLGSDPPAAAPCEVERGAMAQVWNGEQASAIEAAFLRARARVGAESSRRVIAGLDDAAANWVSTWDTACTDPDHPPGVEITQCLEQRLAGVRALSELLVGASEDVVAQSRGAVLGLPSATSCLESDASVLRPVPNDPKVAAVVAALYDDLERTHALSATAQYEDARRASEAVLAKAGEVDFRPLLAEALLRYGTTLDHTGHHEMAAKQLEEAYELASENGYDRLAARAAAELVFVEGTRLAGITEAEQWARHARSHVDRFEASPLDLALVVKAEAQILVHSGRFDEAIVLDRQRIEILRRAWGNSHPAVANTLVAIAAKLLDLGRTREARPLLEEARTILAQTLGADHPTLAHCVARLASTSHAEGDHETAVAYDREAIAIYEKSLGPDHQDLAAVLSNLADTLYAMGKLEEARVAQQRALRIFEHVEGGHPYASNGHVTLARIAEKQDRGDEALHHFREAVDLSGRFRGDQHPMTLLTQSALVWALLRSGDATGALAQSQRMIESTRTGDVPVVRAAEANLLAAQSLELLGRYEEALGELDRVDEFEELPAELTSRATFTRARIQWERGEHREGRRAARELVSTIGDGVLHEELEQWLASH